MGNRKKQKEIKSTGMGTSADYKPYEYVDASKSDEISALMLMLLNISEKNLV